MRSTTLPGWVPLTRDERRELVEYPTDVRRPMTRGDCENGERPCPFVSCRYHLYLDVLPSTGSIRINYPSRDIDDLTETCALDVANRGGSHLEEIAVLLNLTRERIRQLETSALAHLHQTILDSSKPPKDSP